MKEKKVKKKFSTFILDFYNSHGRDFPWRQTKNPYKILLTEILLRRTTSIQVNSIYKEFFDQYPTIKSLSLAKKEDLETVIKCLGLSKQRSVQMIRLANVIMEQHGGVIPKSYDELIELPAVGMYTAGGFLCLAGGENVSMVDTNVVRVVSRYFNFKSTKTESWTDKKLWKFVKDLIPKGKCREFNLGIIDFANAICIPKKPRCDVCKLNNECYYFKNSKILGNNN